MLRNQGTIKQVGIDRLIRLEWLDYALDLVLSGENPGEIKQELEARLSERFHNSPATTRGTLSKTVTILMKVWARTPERVEGLRTSSIKLLTRWPKTNRLPFHWGMMAAVYPFWASVSSQVGRLIRLQGSVAASQVQRRLCEIYGERETVSRRVRYVLRAFVDWRVMSETKSKGVYNQETFMIIENSALIAWLVEASLLSSLNGSASLKDLIEHPSLFPFKLTALSAESIVDHSPRLETIRHGLDENLIMLKV